MSKVVFVGNVPYNMGEECATLHPQPVYLTVKTLQEQLIDVFKSVGQVVGFRLVFDRETGKPRGYGFCEFADHETAASAVRNLNNVDVGGRPLRIDLADSDPFLEGKTTVRGELVDSGGPDSRWRDRDDHRGERAGSISRTQDPNAFLAVLPLGVTVPLGSSSLDMITQTLATMNPNQLMEVLAQMKAFVITHPEQARVLLIKHPQLAYALFQALLLNNIVDRAILLRMLEATSNSGAVPAQAPTPTTHQHTYQHAPPVQQPQPVIAPISAPPLSAGHPNMYQLSHPHQQPPPSIPPQQSYYRPPIPPAPPQQAPPPAAPEVNIDPAQRAMLMQVLNLSPEQINALPPTERNAIQALRNQFISGIAV